MRGNRMLHTIRLCTILSSKRRTEYLRKRQLFKDIGDNCNFMNRTVPLYSKLIKVGNNVKVASGVSFITHDVTHSMLNEIQGNTEKYQEKIGCIAIGDNVFIGAGATILYDVQIGSNVIIGAGSLVNRDVPSNSVVAGIPARVISTFDEYIAKRKTDYLYPEDIAPCNEEISDELIAWCWDEFRKRREKTNK